MADLNIYNVKKGDTLTKIAVRTLKAMGTEKPTSAQINAAIEKLAKQNNLEDPNKIFVGQKLDMSGFKELPDDATLVDYISKKPEQKTPSGAGKADKSTVPLKEDGGVTQTTYALGEEGGGTVTSEAVGEEGGAKQTTYALGEEGGSDDSKGKGSILLKEGGDHKPIDITYALGENGGDKGMTVPLKEDGGVTQTTYALGEEGGGKFTPINITYALGENGGDKGITTMATNEEGGDDNVRITTQATNEEGGDDNVRITTQATNEEGGDDNVRITTMATNEEGGNDGDKITTQATNEEGGDKGSSVPLKEDGGITQTTYAIGEEGGGKFTPINITYALGENGGDKGITTMATNEEGGDDNVRITTMATNEEGGNDGDKITTQATNEEGGDKGSSVPLKEDGGITQTTYAIGEEGGGSVTLAIGEDGGSKWTTMAVGEEGGDKGSTVPLKEDGDGSQTTLALGEDGGSKWTTMAVGEEGGDKGSTVPLKEDGDGSQTTLALGEEGGGSKWTTMAVGEEGGDGRGGITPVKSKDGDTTPVKSKDGDTTPVKSTVPLKEEGEETPVWKPGEWFKPGNQNPITYTLEEIGGVIDDHDCTDTELRRSHSVPIPSGMVKGHGQSPFWIARGYVKQDDSELTPAQRKELQQLLKQDENKQVKATGKFGNSKIGYRYRKEITLSDGTVVKLADDAPQRIGKGTITEQKVVIRNGKEIVEMREVDCVTKQPVDGERGKWQQIEGSPEEYGL